MPLLSQVGLVTALSGLGHCSGVLDDQVAVLVDLGVAMGPVIASIHEKRDEFRRQIKEAGGLDEAPKLKLTS